MPEGAPKLNIAVWTTLLGIVIALLVNIVVVVQYFSKLDARVGYLETDKVTSELRIGQLDTARQATDVHLAHVDDVMNTIGANVSAILDTVQHWDQGDPPSSFPRPSRPRK